MTYAIIAIIVLSIAVILLTCRLLGMGADLRDQDAISDRLGRERDCWRDRSYRKCPYCTYQPEWRPM